MSQCYTLRNGSYVIISGLPQLVELAKKLFCSRLLQSLYCAARSDGDATEMDRLALIQAPDWEMG